MKKLIASMVLGGVLLGSNILRADEVRHSQVAENNHEIARVEKNYNPKNLQNYVNEVLRKALQKNANYNVPDNYNAVPGRQTYGANPFNLAVDKKVQTEEGVKASLNASLTLDKNRNLQAVGFKGDYDGLVGIAVSQDVQSRYNMTQLSFGKDTGVDVTLRNFKDPILQARVTLGGVKLSSLYDSKTSGLLANVAAKGATLNVNWNPKQSLLNATLAYTLPQQWKAPVDNIAWTYMKILRSGPEGHKINPIHRFNVTGSIGPSKILKFGLSADNCNDYHHKKYIIGGSITIREKF